MRALLLCAGWGTRMAPLTDRIPKPLLPLAGRPLLWYTLTHLRNMGVDEVLINVSHLGEQIRDYVRDGAAWDLRVAYSWEEEPLGTAGAIRRAQFLFHDPFRRQVYSPFFVLYGDVLLDVGLLGLWFTHRARNAVLTLGVVESDDVTGKGVVAATEQGYVQGFQEKPGPDAARARPGRSLVHAGALVMSPALVPDIPADEPDLGYDCFPRWIQEQRTIDVHLFRKRERVIDIGTPAGYQAAEAYLTGPECPQIWRP